MSAFSVARDAVFALVREQLAGDQVMVDRLVPGFTVPVRDVQSATAGVEAARLLRDCATRLLREYAERARGEGVTWEQLARHLDLVNVAEERGKPLAEAAFEYVAEGRRPGDPVTWARPAPAVRWTCSSCEQRITDHGPYEADPTEDEHGHAEDCARQAAAVAAWNEER